MSNAHPQNDRYQPTEVELLRSDRAVRFLWADGHQARYPFEYLRGHCACAACRGGDFEPARFRHFPGVVLERIELVGAYALGLLWSDGHDTGIYPFDRLRELCPCSSCRPDGVPELSR